MKNKDTDNNTQNIQNKLDDIISFLKQNGLEGEIAFFKNHKFETTLYNRTIENISNSENDIFALRLSKGKKVINTSFSDFKSYRDIIKRISPIIESLPVDENFSISNSNYGNDKTHHIQDILNIYDNFSPEFSDIKNLLLEMEDIGYSKKQITNVASCSYSKSDSTFFLATSNGFNNFYKKTIFFKGIEVIAGTGTEMQTGYDYTISCSFNKLRTGKDISEKASLDAINSLNPKNIATSQLPVILNTNVSAKFIQYIINSVTGSHVANGDAFIKRADLDKNIFSQNLTIIDAPKMDYLPCSYPFDGEGNIANNRNIIENGKLKGFILDSYYARKIGYLPTGNASRRTDGSIASSHSNLYVKSGNIGKEDLLSNIKKGVYITEFFGFGLNMATGDFSQGARGFMIENGKITYPINEFTVSGNVKNALQDIKIANNLNFWYLINAPDILISGLTVASK